MLKGTTSGAAPSKLLGVYGVRFCLRTECPAAYVPLGVPEPFAPACAAL